MESQQIPKADEDNTGTLFLVSTPIGNYDDITLRAIKVLQKCDIVICEELKEGASLLKRLGISKKLEDFNEQNEDEKTGEIIKMLKMGQDLALISDAGTPVFADPGFNLVRKALELKLKIEVVPGPSSIMAAVVRCGFSIEQFVFAGFLSRLKQERLRQLERLSKEARTVILLETPYRLNAILDAAASVMPERKAYLGMNLTMPYETHHYGTFSELWQKFEEKKFKGEFVICFEGVAWKDSEAEDEGGDVVSRTRSTGFRRDRSDGFRRDSGRKEFSSRTYGSRDSRDSDKPYRSRSSSSRGFSDRNDDDRFNRDKPYRARETKRWDSKEDSASRSSGEGRRYSRDSSSEGRKYSRDSSSEGRKYSRDSSGEGRKYSRDSSGEGRKYSRDSSGEGRKYSRDSSGEGRKYSRDSSGEGKKYSRDSNKSNRRSSSERPYGEKKGRRASSSRKADFGGVEKKKYGKRKND